MRHICKGILVTIEAMHNFGSVHDRRVFCGGTYQDDRIAASRWGADARSCA